MGQNAFAIQNSKKSQRVIKKIKSIIIIIIYLFTTIFLKFYLSCFSVSAQLKHTQYPITRDQTIFPFQPFSLSISLSLLHCHISSSDFLSLTKIFSPSFNVPLDPSLPKSLLSSFPPPGFQLSHLLCDMQMHMRLSSLDGCIDFSNFVFSRDLSDGNPTR